MTAFTPSGIVGPTHWQRTGRLIEAVRPMARQARLRIRHRSTQHTSTQKQRNGEPSVNPGGFCVFKVDMRKETAPARVACQGRLCRNSRLDGAWGGKPRPAEVL